MKRIRLICLFGLITLNAFAHSDWYFRKQYGNVAVEILTGFDFEDKNKVWIAGQLIEKLSDELRNNSVIVVNIKHTYTTPDFVDKYCVSYQLDTIYILGFCYRVEPQKLLSLAEYAIKNKDKIAKRQEQKVIHLPYNRKVTHCSVSDSCIEQILTAPISKVVAKIQQNKIYRPVDEEDKDPMTTYYFQDNKYHITGRRYIDNQFRETKLAEFDHIFQFSVIYHENIFLFDTDSTFYFIDGASSTFMPEHNISKRQVFDKMGAFCPYRINHLGRDRVCITLWFISRIITENIEGGILRKSISENNMVYLTNDDVLIQNLDDMIDLEVKKIRENGSKN